MSMLDKYRHTIKWVFIALLVKGVFFVWFNNEFKQTHWAKENRIVKGIFVEAKDWSDYIAPIQNLIDSGYLGAYYGKDKGILWAHRMPGFIPIYAPLHFLMDYQNACVVIAFLQFFTDALACYIIALIALNLFNNMLVFYLTYFLYLISSFVSVYTHYGSSEPFCTFFIILSVYYFVIFQKSTQKKHFFLTGFFICWAYFLRPAIGVLIVLYPLIYIINNGFFKLKSFKYVFRDILIYSSTFILFESVWIYRNFKVMNRFIPMDITAENFANPQYRVQIQLCIAYGAEYLTDSKDNLLGWFHPSTRNDTELYNSNPFPPHCFTPDYNLDSLRLLRQYYWSSIDKDLSLDMKKKYATETVDKLNLYKKSYIKYHPFRYYVVNRFILLRKFLFVTQTYALPFEKHTLFQKLVRGVYWGINTFVIALGIVGITLSFYKKNKLAWSLSLLLLAHIFVHAVILGYIEHRYLVTVFPLLTIYSSYTVSLALAKNRFLTEWKSNIS